MHTQPQYAYSSSGQAYTCTGTGPALILLHGWPFHSATFRALIPLLARHYSCYALDSAGMGYSAPPQDGDFSFAAHARRVAHFADELGLDTFALIGHDTGGTIARMLAANNPHRVSKLIVMATEVPGHIPAAVPRYQRLLRYAPMRRVFFWALRSKAFGRSDQSFRSCFHDPALVTDEFLELFSLFWTETPERLDGLIRYLMAIDHATIDELDQIHRNIKAPTLVLWGEHDRIFPLPLAEAMVAKMPSCRQFAVIPLAGFLVHEESPRAVADCIHNFAGTE